MAKRLAFLLTCEHASNKFPPELKQLVTAKHKTLLASHRGWDIGAFTVARHLGEALGVDLFACEFSRLLIDCNRSTNHPELFSEMTKNLPEGLKQQLVEEFYIPYRSAVTDEIAQFVKQDLTVVHLGIHSFTPVFNGKQRQAEVGVLYDPGQPLERKFADEFKPLLQELRPEWRIRNNYPYQGKSDGFTTALRQQFKPTQYVGVEIEINQSLVGKAAQCRQVAEALGTTLKLMFSNQA